jgi:hypothetical protein
MVLCFSLIVICSKQVLETVCIRRLVPDNIDWGSSGICVYLIDRGS